MKKILLLAGIVAAVFGIKKLMGGKEDVAADDTYAGNGYAPQPQP